jgi:cytochrome oxidase assembly protein ShyY1
MIWIAIVLTAVAVTIPLLIVWGFWQLENINIDEIDWRYED